MRKNLLIQAVVLILSLMVAISSLSADELTDLRTKAATGGAEDRIAMAVKLIGIWREDELANLREARDILVGEANKGNAEAQYRLGALLVSGAITAKEAEARAAASVKAENDKFKADRSMENASAAGMAYIVALMQEQKKMAGQKEKERTEGVSWLRTSMAQGHDEAALKLAKELTSDKDNPAQYQEGKILYSKLAEQGNPTALLAVADDHRDDGRIVEAEKIYRSLAGKGNKVAMGRMVELLMAPERSEAEKQEATGFMRKLSEIGGRYEREKFLEHLLREGAPSVETEEGLELLTDYADNKGLDFAREIFKDRLEKGQALPKEFSELADLYRAAKTGDVVAGKVIGEAFLYGIPPFPSDHWAADNILNEAAYKNKDFEAMLLLGVAFSRDINSTFMAERMFKKASEAGPEELAELYAQACLFEDPTAMRLIAMLRFQENQLLGKNQFAAFYWAEKGAEQGESRAQQILAALYFSKGEMVEGLAWIKAAAAKLRWEKPERAVKKYKISEAQIAEADKLAEKYKKYAPQASGYQRKWLIRRDWRQLGNEHYDRGEDYLGILAYHHALREDPSQPDVMVDLATLYSRIDSKGAAIELLETVEMLFPDHLMALFNLGWIYRDVKLNEECRRVWARFLRKADQEKHSMLIEGVKKNLREMD